MQSKAACLLVFVFGLVLKVSLVSGATQNNSKMQQDPEMVAASHDSSDDDVVEASQELNSRNVIKERESTRINNNIHIDGNLTASARRENPDKPKASIIPMIGATAYSGRWYDHVSNSYSLGLALEVPTSELLALELEGNYGRFAVGYSGLQHNFNQYSLGGNAKLYLIRSVIAPYVGAGMHGVYFENMYTQANNPLTRYNRWVGAGSLMAGADVNVGQNMAVGLRAAWYIPVINRPGTMDNGYVSAPGYEDAAAINSTFYRIMGTVKVTF